jgi:NAD(P)-dependent dehydrogenase (short-subunit alcohol dehydrogenase family)
VTWVLSRRLGGDCAVTTPARSLLPVAVVTGASRGIGFEVCRQLAALGYAVVLGSRDLRQAELAAKELDPEGERVTPARVEVDNSVNIAQLAEWVRERYGRLDAIVNNASTAPDRWAIAGTTDLSPVAEALDVNLFGAWRVTQALLPLLRSSPRPRVVNVSSEGGSIALMSGGRPAYSVSKAALNALTRMLAGELYRDGILVNAVCPGWTKNDTGSSNRGGNRSAAQGAASVVWAVTLPNGGPTGTFTRDGRELPWLGLGTGPGQRPAARREVGADPGDAGVVGRGVGNGANRLLDRLGRLGVGREGQLVPDEGDLVVRELAAKEGEERQVVVLGYAFRVTGPEPADDVGQEAGKCHGRLGFQCLTAGWPIW